jgi:hypothetical protein
MLLMPLFGRGETSSSLYKKKIEKFSTKWTYLSHFKLYLQLFPDTKPFFLWPGGGFIERRTYV